MTAESASFNMFRNLERTDLCCAIPEDQAVPRFVTDAAWVFVGRATEGSKPRGFDPDVALEGAARIGFYLFQEVR